MEEETDVGPLPDDFEVGLAEEVEAVLQAIREAPDTDEARQQYDDLEVRVHPVAETFIAALDKRPEFAETDLTPELRQFLYCASQIAAQRLYSAEELIRLPVNAFLHFAVMAMVGYQACRAIAAGEVHIPDGPKQG